MSQRWYASLGVLVVMIAVVSLASGPVAGQAPTATSRTAWGDPDLQGTWESRSGTPLERPKEFGTREFMTEQEAAERARRGADQVSGDDDDVGTNLANADVRRYATSDAIDPNRPGARISGAEYNAFWNAPVNPRARSLRTSQIVDPPDGRVPPLTEETLKRLEAKEQARARAGRSQGDDWFDRNVMERCLLRQGLPMGEMNQINEIMQAPGYVAITMQYGMVRIIPLDGRPHAGEGLRKWWGDSRGRWEGNTLVVETNNFIDRQDGGSIAPSHGGIFGHNHAHNYPGSGETLRVVERITRIDPETIEYRYTVEDPKVFVRPWTAVNTWAIDNRQSQIFEYSCHEHNYGMVNALSGARVDPKWALDEAAREVNDRKEHFKAEWEELKKWQEANKGSSR